ncbi:N/A [soil metagenome]
MILERGRVVEVDGRYAWIGRAGATGCARCEAGAGCGGGLFAQLAGPRFYRVRARNATAPIRVGDLVVIALPERALLRAACAVYGVPLVGLVLGAVLAQAVAGSGSDLLVLAGGAAGLAAGAAWLRQFSRAAAGNPRFEPCIVERLPPAGHAGAASLRGC